MFEQFLKWYNNVKSRMFARDLFGEIRDHF